MNSFIKNCLLLTHIVVFVLLSSAQNTSQSLDSLTQKSFQELSDLFYSNKPDTIKCIQYANAFYEKALIKKDTSNLITGKYYLADIKNNDSIYLNYCDSLINITKKKPSKNFPAFIYFKKGKYLYHKREKSLSLKNLLLVRKQKIRNDSLQNITNVLIAAIKSNMGKRREAISLYKKVYHYALKNNFINNDGFNIALLNLAISYQKSNQLDSALYYNRKAINLYKKLNDSLSLGFTYYSQGGIFFRKKEYRKSLNSYLKFISSAIQDENYRILISTYSRIGDLYDTLNITYKPLLYHLKADSLSLKTNTNSLSLSKTYKYLINHYKKENHLEKQLEYINKLLKLNIYYSKEKEKINKIFTEKYDIPNLLAEKKKIISELENKVKISRRNRFIYISLLVFFLVMIGYQIKKKRTYKKRFLKLINQKRSGSIKFENQTSTKEKQQLSDTIISNILSKLDIFEKNQDFLSNTISLTTLANQLNTNANYLSKVINQHKQNTFTNYINKLRIEYTVDKLKHDLLWRKYTIKAIAKEVGFKNAESFSNAFYKFTELKPSYFIKELEKN